MNFCPIESALDRHLTAQDRAERAWDAAASQVDRDEVRADIVADIANDPDAFHDFVLGHDCQVEATAYDTLTAAGYTFGPLTREGQAMASMKKCSDTLLADYIDSRYDEYFDAAVRRMVGS